MPSERLQKILSNAGIASRREAEEWILEGRIMVNGQPATELGARADLDVDEVLVDGVPIDRSRYRYFMLNKPVGVLTSASDDRGRATVVDLVPIGDIVLHPVGRLDLDSEGLVLLTNDGHLTDLLTHPRNQVDKEYLVGLDAPISKQDIERLVRGVESRGDRLRAAGAMIVAPPEKDREAAEEIGAWVLITLREGKNREIRRMMEVIDRKVLLLRRVRVASLVLGSLGNGSFRELEEAEVSGLYRSAMAAARRAAQIEDAREAADAREANSKPRMAPPGSRGGATIGGTFAPRPPQGKPARGNRLASSTPGVKGPRAKPGPGSPGGRPGGRPGGPRPGAPRAADERGRRPEQPEHPGGGASRRDVGPAAAPGPNRSERRNPSPPPGGKGGPRGPQGPKSRGGSDRRPPPPRRGQGR